MKLPTQGTYERMVLDYLFTVVPRGSRSMKQIKENFGTAIPTSTLERVIESGRADRTIVAFSKAGFALSSEARKLFYAEQAATPTPSVRNVLTGPALHPSKFLKTTGTRDGSDWSQFKSRQL